MEIVKIYCFFRVRQFVARTAVRIFLSVQFNELAREGSKMPLSSRIPILRHFTGKQVVEKGRL